MREHRGGACALMTLGLVACSREEVKETEIHEISLEEDLDCRVDDPVLFLAAEVATPVGRDGTVRLTAGSPLTLRLSNTHPEPGTATVRARSVCERSATDAESVNVDVPARGAAEVALTAEALRLPQGALDFSGLLRIWASIEYDGGGDSYAPGSLVLWFHPDGRDWLLYDSDTRARLFSDGALTDAARDLRAEAILAAPPDSAVTVTSPGTVIKVSDDPDYSPPLPAPGGM